jgi:hypothetical protein
MIANRPVQILACTALALSLNVAFAWVAVESTATVRPLRVWEVPHAIADDPAASRLALDAQAQSLDAALVQ